MALPMMLVMAASGLPPPPLSAERPPFIPPPPMKPWTKLPAMPPVVGVWAIGDMVETDDEAGMRLVAGVPKPAPLALPRLVFMATNSRLMRASSSANFLGAVDSRLNSSRSLPSPVVMSPISRRNCWRPGMSNFNEA
jgi:hypothetical protein